jgi:thioredoxin reductase (NADPH)
VENYPGYPDGVMGPEMMGEFRRQAERFGTDFVTDDVTGVDFSERPFRVWVEDEEYRARSVIIATGASARWLGLESEDRLKNHGVSACATCDGAFFRDKHIFVVGGGDTAFEEALFLTRFGYKVTIVHRRNEFRASQIMVDRARTHEKIEFRTPYAIDEVLGESSISGLRLRNTETDETEEVEAGALFIAIGHDPNTKLFVDQLDHDENGYLVTKPDTTETNIAGVFAAGDVQDHIYRQAVTAAGTGCMAALDAERFLAAEEGHAATALTAPRPEAEPTKV